jgi:hypothetical protein
VGSIGSYILHGLIKFFDDSFLSCGTCFVLVENEDKMGRKKYYYNIKFTFESPMARTTIYFLPVRISSVTMPKFSEDDEVAKVSWEPVTTQPASSAITIPAHTSQGQQPISLTNSDLITTDLKRKKEIPI